MNYIRVSMPRGYFRAVGIKDSMIPQVEITASETMEADFYDAAAQLVFRIIYG